MLTVPPLPITSPVFISPVILEPSLMLTIPVVFISPVILEPAFMSTSPVVFIFIFPVILEPLLRVKSPLFVMELICASLLKVKTFPVLILRSSRS